MLTRPRFANACKAFAIKFASVVSQNTTSWLWNEIPSRPGYGYLSRTVLYNHLPKRARVDEMLGDSDYMLEEPFDDAALVHSTASELITSLQYVVFSGSFQVPAFYFTMHDSNGTPLALSEIVESSIFKYRIPNTELTTFALSLSFPLLSQGDHPTLGTPCWYFHPCESANAVEELMREVDTSGLNEDQRLLRWLEMWFMVVGTILNLSHFDTISPR